MVFVRTYDTNILLSNFRAKREYNDNLRKQRVLLVDVLVELQYSSALIYVWYIRVSTVSGNSTRRSCVRADSAVPYTSILLIVISVRTTVGKCRVRVRVTVRCTVWWRIVSGPTIHTRDTAPPASNAAAAIRCI